MSYLDFHGLPFLWIILACLWVSEYFYRYTIRIILFDSSSLSCTIGQPFSVKFRWYIPPRAWFLKSGESHSVINLQLKKSKWKIRCLEWGRLTYGNHLHGWGIFIDTPCHRKFLTVTIVAGEYYRLDKLIPLRINDPRIFINSVLFIKLVPTYVPMRQK